MWCSLVITWGFHPHNPSSNLGMDIPGLVAQSVERLVSSEQTGDRRSPGPICRGGWFRRPFSMGPEGVRFTSAAQSAMPQRSGAPLRMECNSQAGSTPVVDTSSHGVTVTHLRGSDPLAGGSIPLVNSTIAAIAQRESTGLKPQRCWFESSSRHNCLCGVVVNILPSHGSAPGSIPGMDLLSGLVVQSVERLVRNQQTGVRISPGPISRGGWQQLLRE